MSHQDKPPEGAYGRAETLPDSEFDPTHVVEILDDEDRVTARHPVGEGAHEIGRSYRSDLLVDDPHVCPSHARLLVGPSEVRIENLSAVNGVVDEDGTAIESALLPLDRKVRLGSARLRVRSIDHALPPAEAYGVLRNPSVRRRWFWALLALAVFLALVLWESWSTTIRFLEWEETLLNLVQAAIGASVWAGLWALGSRIFRKRAFFAEHLAIFCAGMVVVGILSELTSLALFWGGSDGAPPLLSLASGAVVFAVVLGAHLRLVARRPRWGFAVAIAAVFVAIGLVTEHSTRDEFQYFPSHQTELSALPASWLSFSSLDDVFADAAELRERLDEEVQEELAKKLEQKRERAQERTARQSGGVEEEETMSPSEPAAETPSEPDPESAEPAA